MPSNSEQDFSRPSLRRATADDVAALVLLMHDFYAESGHALDHEWAAASFRSLLACPDLGGVWIVHIDTSPVGHAVLSVRYTMEFGGLGGCIDDLYVKPNFRRIGAGQALLEALFAECRARGCKSVHVEVGASNAPALAMYAKFTLKAAQDGRVLLSGALPDAGTGHSSGRTAAAAPVHSFSFVRANSHGRVGGCGSTRTLQMSVRTATLRIRRYEEADWPSLWPLLHTTFLTGDTYAFAPESTEAEIHMAWVEVPAATFVACSTGGVIVGTYFIKPNQPGLGSHVCNCGYVVAPEARGQGVASVMCEHSQAEAISMGFRAMQFNLVAATNERAVRLWCKLGFSVVGTLPRAFRHRSRGFVDALVMFKQLST
jgi:ribosomal protein S18 acetylase RimI-like enzyme